MQDKPKLSICTSIYNTDPVKLKNFLESLLNQTYSNMEIVLVDDFSTSLDTINILKNLENNKQNLSKKLTVIYNSQNLGLIKSFQRALDHAEGEYFAFPEPDDFIDFDFYEIAMEDIIYHKADAVKGLLLYKYNNRDLNQNSKLAEEDKEAFSILENTVLPIKVKNSRGEIISYLMPDITYCWFYVFSKKLLSYEYKKPNFKNAVFYGFSASLYSQFKSTRISLEKASFYHYDAHDRFSKPGIYREDDSFDENNWEYKILKDILKQYKKVKKCK